jgi:S1-C subfamily serine protease
VRPSHVALLCLLAALAGAGGVIVAAERGGWLHGSQTVLVRTPLSRDTTAPTVVVSKPVLARGFQPQRIFAERAPGVVTVFSYYGSQPASSIIEQGSGFVVNRSGIILTAAHVIVSTTGTSALATPAHAVYVQFTDGDRVRADIVGWDPYDDVGVLKVNPHAHVLVPVPLGSSTGVEVGQPVAAIGSPFGNAASLSVGVVSGTGRTIPSLTTSYDLFDAIQTDAPINEGNSGGPLLDARGDVIGINAQMQSSLEAGFEGVGFAVPVDSVKRSLTQLLASGHVPYAYLGLKTENLTPAIAARFGYRARFGALVDVVTKGGPAARAGLRPGTRKVVFEGQELTVGGDAIVAIDGSPVASSDAVAALVAERLVPGEVAWFTVVRAGHERVVPIVLGARPQ